MLVEFPMPLALVGALLTTVAACLLSAEGLSTVRVQRHRRDAYDLSLLKDAETYTGPSRDNPEAGTEKPSWESEDGDAVYCHQCDVSIPAANSICPNCGKTLL